MFSLLAILYGLAFGYFTYRRPRPAIAALVALLPTYGLRFTVVGLPLTLLEVTIWAVAIGWFARVWRDHAEPRWPSWRQASSQQNPFAPYFWPILLWLVVASAALSYSPNLVAALGLWKAYFIEPLIVFVIVVITFKNREERWWLVSALGVTVVVLSAVAWYQHFTGLAIPEPWASTRPLRVTSWYSYPNAVGLFIGPIVSMYFMWLSQSFLATPKKVPGTFLKGTWYLFSVAVFVLGLGAIVFAVSKGAWVGVAVGCFVGAMISFRAQRRMVLAAAVVLATAVLIVAPIRTRVLDEFLFHSPSGAMRRVVWSETMALLQDQPIAGAGLAGYQTALIPYHQPWHPEVSPYALEIFLYPHNVFLNFWVELGLAGLIVFVWLLIAFYRQAWLKRDRPLAMAAMAGMATLLVHGLVDVPFFKNDLAVLFWLIMVLPLLEPTVHEAHRDAKWFDLIKSGVKTFEARLFDDKRKVYAVGDYLVIQRRPDGSTMKVAIAELIVKPTFRELFTEVGHEPFGFASVEHGLGEVRRYYGEKEEQTNGVVGIRVRVIGE